jgi:hypothetical protein
VAASFDGFYIGREMLRMPREIHRFLPLPLCFPVHQRSSCEGSTSFVNGSRGKGSALIERNKRRFFITAALIMMMDVEEIIVGFPLECHFAPAGEISREPPLS